MQKQFVEPELKLAGEADKIILGSGGAGGDFFNEYQIQHGFADDRIADGDR